MRRIVTVVALLPALALASAPPAAAGGHWKRQKTPNPKGALLTSLEGVSCPSPTACIAVGSYTGRSGGDFTLAERWDGTYWRIQPTPNHKHADIDALHSVSCADANACMAVGDFYPTSGSQPYLPLTERWNGTTWHIEPVPVPDDTREADLWAVSCARPDSCVAVGTFQRFAGGPEALAEAWGGSTWTILPTANVPGTSANLLAVSCWIQDECIAVGGRGANSGRGVSLAEKWDGSAWTFLPTPSPKGFRIERLTTVSCSSASACTAVGFRMKSGREVSLAETWDGATWLVQDTRDESNYTVLSGVSCSAPSACTAVGEGTGRKGVVTLAETWDGATWTIESTPHLGSSSRFSAIACPSPMHCTAVGDWANRRHVQTLAARR
jgi:hypothetical protein